ncbi:AraC family transcriptional regulator ligand-binding domain-containing protein [Nocardioides sp.]|uniref:AraC family transcriptional regulator n=1 Tax=Nocardioides sp. TaxID=35761 RepID=UPI00378414AE
MREIAVGPAARTLLADLGVDPRALLRRAGLSPDLLAGSGTMPLADYYALWRVLEDEVGPQLAVRVAELLRIESVDPAVLAALCSVDLVSAADRIATHKSLLGPLGLAVDDSERGLRVTVGFPEVPPPPPVVLHAELAFWVRLARTGTRTRVVPLSLTAPAPPPAEAAAALAEVLGAEVRPGPTTSVTFSRLDARRRFVTADEALQSSLDELLRRRVAEHGAGRTADAAAAALLELLPAGRALTSEVALRLGTSPRTLQRRLAAEGTSFGEVLDRTRAELATHYLEQGRHSVAEIAFLLGYDDPGSFYRAHRSWTGRSPRAAAR